MKRKYAGETLEQLKAAGYRGVSRAYGIVARVEVSDDELVKILAKNNIEIIRKDLDMWRDHWRRIHSQDWIEGVPRNIYRYLRVAR